MSFNTPVPDPFSLDWWLITILGLILLYDLFNGGRMWGIRKVKPSEDDS